MLLTEIEPRLKSLTKQVNKLQKKGEIEAELKELQLTYYGKTWHEIKDSFNEVNKQFLEMEKIKMEKEKKLDTLKRELGQMEMQNSVSQEFEQWQRELSRLQNKKDELTKEQAKLEAQMEVKLETSGQFDLSWLTSRKNTITKELSLIREESQGLEKNIQEERATQNKLNDEKNHLNKKFNELNVLLSTNTKSVGGEDIKKLNHELKNLLVKIEEADRAEDLAKIKNLIKEINDDLKNILASTENAGLKENLEKIQHDVFELARGKEEISGKINEISIRITSLSERKRLLDEKANQLQNEL